MQKTHTQSELTELLAAPDLAQSCECILDSNTIKDNTYNYIFSMFQHDSGQLAEYQRGVCTHTFSNGLLRIGALNEHSIAEIKGLHPSNLVISTKIRFVDFGNDPESWVGLQFRGFRPATLGGYVVYLRASGSVELFTPEYEVIKLLRVHFNPVLWLELSIIAYDETLIVRIIDEDQNQQDAYIDRLKFSSEGWISLQAYHAISEFDYIKIWNITNSDAK